MKTNPWVVAVTGGSGSGKTTLARNILKVYGPSNCVIVGQDSYYFDQSESFDHDGGSVNFDHPDSIDFSLLADHLRTLKSGHKVEIPIYDFTSHTRKKHTLSLKPHQLILVDGILILSQLVLRPLFDESVFIDADETLRFERRLRRDVNERGRTPDGVKEQFFKQVKPMHDQFVAPSKVHASILISEGQMRVQKPQPSSFQKEMVELISRSMLLP